MADRKIKLTRQAQTQYTVGSVDGFRFTVTASDAVDMPNEIFLYIRRPASGEQPETDAFESVCSAVDLETYPIGDPEADASPPFFRTASIDLVFRSQSLADDVWTQIQADVTTLVESLNLMDELGDPEEVWIGPL